MAGTKKARVHDDGLVVFDATVDDMQVFNTMCANALQDAGRQTKKPKGGECRAGRGRDVCSASTTRRRNATTKLNRLLVKHAAGTLDFTLKCPIELLKSTA